MTKNNLGTSQKINLRKTVNHLAYASTVPTPCFTAITTGNTGSRVAGDVFAIDCNNNRNF